jgi:hypothetical protein
VFITCATGCGVWDRPRESSIYLTLDNEITEKRLGVLAASACLLSLWCLRFVCGWGRSTAGCGCLLCVSMTSTGQAL